MTILRVGLTGGIASGKSTVGRILAELGCRVVDADEVVRELYKPGAAGHRALAAAYGEEILTATGEVDRQKLSDIALSTPAGADQLNALIHPLVIAWQKEWFARLEREAGEHDVVGVVEATLLIESGGRDRYDRIIVVDAAPELQLSRGVARGSSEAEVRKRMTRQMARQERMRHADLVIRNDADLSSLRDQTLAVHQSLVRELRARSE